MPDPVFSAKINDESLCFSNIELPLNFSFLAS